MDLSLLVTTLTRILDQAIKEWIDTHSRCISSILVPSRIAWMYHRYLINLHQLFCQISCFCLTVRMSQKSYKILKFLSPGNILYINTPFFDRYASLIVFLYHRILVQNMEEFKDQVHSVIWHIISKFQKEMSTKSKVVSTQLKVMRS